MPGRHLSAQELDFLKEAYRKNQAHETGGHTLNLIDPEIPKRFRGRDKTAFESKYNEDMRDVTTKLEAQKATLTNTFVEGERERVRAKGPMMSKSTTHHDTGTLPNVQVQDKQQPQRGVDAKSAFRLRNSKQMQMEQLTMQLGEVNAELERLGVSRNRSGAVKDERAIQEYEKKRHRTRKRENLRKIKQQLRSDLEKEAQAISHKDAHRFHVKNRFKSSSLDTYQYRQTPDAIDPAFNSFRIQSDMMTQYADSLSKAPDLRGPF